MVKIVNANNKIMKKPQFTMIMVSSVTTRLISIFDGKYHYSVEIDFDVPFDEITLNAYEQLSPKFTNHKKRLSRKR